MYDSFKDVTYKCSFPDICPAQVGLPLGTLPHHGVQNIYLLPQLHFPCPGSIHKVHFYSGTTGSSVRIGIARWIDEPLNQAEVIHVISDHVGETGLHIIQLEEKGIEVNVQENDFVVIIGSEAWPSPIVYMGDTDQEREGSYIQLTIKLDAQTDIKDVIDAAVNSTMERKIFAISFDITNIQEFVKGEFFQFGLFLLVLIKLVLFHKRKKFD